MKKKSYFVKVTRYFIEKNCSNAADVSCSSVISQNLTFPTEILQLLKVISRFLKVNKYRYIWCLKKTTLICEKTDKSGWF